jgi:peptide chain release factor 1
MLKKIQEFLIRLKEVEAALAHPDAYLDQKKYRELTQEHSYLSDVKHHYDEIEALKKHLKENDAALKTESDSDFVQMLKDDSQQIEARLPELQKGLEVLLVPPDPNDSRNTILEIRAGTGGDEAALFVGDCVRMYRLFSDQMGWKSELLSCTESEMGGFKEYIFSVSGANCYRFLKYEGGTHRVQRVPETEAQGRVHTSAITVAVLLEPDDNSDVKIDEKDLRVDTYRSSGAGGQHVNTTDSAVRLTHLPTGIVVYCQEERSQHKNKEKAMRLLKAKMIEVEMEKKRQEIASSRSEQVGSGDRSERIRTYNFPQNRVTDHRINMTTHNLDQVMQGKLMDFASALVAHYRQEELKE